MNWQGVRTIFQHEMARFYRTFWESLAAPTLSTVLYFIVFGAAIGNRVATVDGTHYGSFIVPGLIMLTVVQQSLSNASFGIFMPKFIGTTYEILSAPLSFIEIVMGYVGAATLKSVIIGLVTLGVSAIFVSVRIQHPVAMLAILSLTSLGFSLIGFLIGIWARDWQQLQLIPMLVLTPLTFLGGVFFSVSMLPPFWAGLARLNPVLHLVSWFRWSFFEQTDVPILWSAAVAFALIAGGLGAVWAIFRTGWRIRS